MKLASLLASTCAAILLCAVPAWSADREAPATTPEGLKLVKRPGLDTVYLREGVSFAKYERVMLDPVEVSFDKNWDPRRGSAASLETVDPAEIQRDLAKLARQVFQRELEKKGGYPLVDEPADDVLRVRARIVDLYINAPEPRTASPTRIYVINAGEMTLMAELYDSVTNTLLAEVIDRQRGMERGLNELQIANRVTNTAEADRILTGWARRLRDALDKARAPEQGASSGPSD
ncbi:MAG TPA: DUF3313 family protein [Steroidobacteraceae bacterium]|jgi:hypothetical protein|nr:DUF3313 family protein [Steroidobacteraceae bacterium]